MTVTQYKSSATVLGLARSLPAHAGRGGSHALDLSAALALQARVADYEAAFGMPSPLHHHTRGVRRLRELLHVAP